MRIGANPWPDGDAPVIFLLDARGSFDRRLLEGSIAAHSTPGRTSEIVALDLRDDRKSLLVQELVTAITRHPEAIVAPLRLCWTRPDEVASKGPKLTDIFRVATGVLRDGWPAPSPGATQTGCI
jgi:hypothetical protein